ncbi:ABC transporter permease [Halodesulfurarchaeum formicicum]|uniref:ABC transporter permease n=1 Tax=Halodesulfurarchaeum formicicum TaxID=1873524 RepID=UPI00087801C8|nr:ABC transporter permease [Halodesulfurarchaeum formicicum]
MTAARRSSSRLLLLLGPFVALGVVWEAGARGGVIDARFFPPPTAVLGLAVELYVHGDFLTHLLASLRRVLLGGLLGTASGVTMGLLAGRNGGVRAILDPHLSVLYPLPKIAILPVMFSIFGVSETARILTMALAVFLLVTINTMDAVTQIEDQYIAAARDNGAGRVAIYREVVLPSILPQVASGLSLGLGIAVVLLVIIEMVAADSGLGYVIWTSWQQFKILELYVALFSINVLGLVFVHGPEEIGDWLTPWQQQ